MFFFISKYLYLNWNIVKSFIFYQKLSSVSSHVSSFYDIAHLWTIDCVLSLDIHMQTSRLGMSVTTQDGSG